MNLDLLIKLVKLANNNPSENEANLAARKVCKMIAEANYKFNNSTTPSQVKPLDINFNDLMRDIVNYGRNEQQRQQQSYDYETAAREQQKRQQRYEEQKKAKWTYEPVFTNDPIFNGPRGPKKEKRILKCCICGKETETAFVGPPQAYRCLLCDWTEYEEKKVKVK